MQSEGEATLRLKPETNACYVCGPDNAVGLQVPFAPDGPHGCRAVYTARLEHCGWPGLLHGGVALALLDEALAWALYYQKLFGVTARMETRFRQPIPVGTKLIVRAWTLDRRRRLVNARAEIRLDAEDNPLVAEANATMYLQELEGNQKD
ncbi:MAG: PaaI family thioesterase [Acidobacteria bacterium]|nr:PaaI family thioesterase [Acidobacteriota bacterium]